MYRKERVDKILSILRDNGYVNVKYLCDEIGYSKATMYRVIVEIVIFGILLSRENGYNRYYE